MQFFHATNVALRPGDVLTGRAGMSHPDDQTWRSEYVWMAADPGNAGAWWGHDTDDVHVYEVTPERAVVIRHEADAYDDKIAADHGADQFYAPTARVVRRLALSEWNDYHQPTARPSRKV